ncbi:hypothetical protein [Mucilaginibacter pedocola]|uniref:HNH domain-containing protein n=1 Tax=Mucilaginibacter pedocola TaxID=1792845 RepID=A0A1S9PLV0_9SPHI|nr:hypothetical protein [Mucilaginibacter pedocola]OOQ61909.1 hypothetical protein BC343_02275 [Mucilaginibacter pedocola]
MDQNTTEKKGRDDFETTVINIVKTQAAYICSNPDCRKLTIAPSLTDENKVQYMGKVAHITAASPGGPRYDSSYSEAERTNINNAIFLCSNCADLIDKNKGIDYKKEVLFDWKTQHKNWVLENLNKSKTDTSAIAVSSYGQRGGIIAQVVNITSNTENQRDPIKEHDIENFRLSEKVLNNEQWVKLREDLLGDASCRKFDSDRLDNVLTHFSRAENGFIDEEINEAKENFIATIPALKDIIDCHFDLWPYQQDIENYSIQLKPHYLRHNGYVNPTMEQRREWEELFEQMKVNINALNDTYNIFRKTIKRKLHI